MERNKTIGRSRLCVNVSLHPLDVGVVLRAESLGVPAAGASALPGWEGINVCVRRDGEGACAERGFAGCVLERSRYGAWVTHPDRRQCSGVSRSCWEMPQPWETPQPRLRRPAEPPNNLLLEYHQDFFSILTVCCWGKLTMSSVCVPVTVTEDDSSKRNHYISFRQE